MYHDTNNFSGDTGPLVYPAGFVYIYSILYFLTSAGQNIRLAQYIFIGIYLLQLYLVLRLYSKSRKIPPYVILITTFTSYRVHSIYVLRLFNDPIAVLFLYISINLFVDRKWYIGSVLFSVAVSIKMNILLFAPALFLFYLTNLGVIKTFIHLTICAAVQLILGLPFLISYPVEYIKGSFDIGRVFDHKWTVNYRFFEKDFFENKIFHVVLLCIHMCLLLVFLKPSLKYFRSYAIIRALEEQLQPQIDRKNKEVMETKIKRKSKKEEKTTITNTEEKLSAEENLFLKSFEKALQKSSKSESISENSELEDNIEKYSIHFDKSSELVLLPLFLSNFIGIVCARSLHYQFYIWYFHSLPYLTWYTDFKITIKFLILAVIEFSWNTYPSTIFSSLLLHISHLILLYGISRKFLKS